MFYNFPNVIDSLLAFVAVLYTLHLHITLLLLSIAYIIFIAYVYPCRNFNIPILHLTSSTDPFSPFLCVSLFFSFLYSLCHSLSRSRSLAPAFTLTLILPFSHSLDSLLLSSQWLHSFHSLQFSLWLSPKLSLSYSFFLRYDHFLIFLNTSYLVTLRPHFFTFHSTFSPQHS